MISGKNKDRCRQLRQRLKRKAVIQGLGVYDALSALIVERSGFELLFVGGFGASASLLGLPDLEFVTLTEMADVVRHVADRVRIPVIADGDTGHGGVHNVARTVEEMERAGAAGVILEDQVSPKRCGHFSGKVVIPASEMVIKLRAAVRARTDPNFLIVARTDARDTHGLKEAVRRGKLYRQAGADVIFVESPGTVAELTRLPRLLRGPLLINMLTGGKTPILSPQQLEKMGYRIIAYPVETLMAAAASVERTAQALRRTGSVEPVRSEILNFNQLQQLLRVEDFLK